MVAIVFARPLHRRVLRGFWRPLLIGLTTLLFGAAAATAGGRDGEEPGESVNTVARQAKLVDPALYELPLGASDTVTLRESLDWALQQRIAVLDRVCRMTDAQKGKAALAGRGDIKRVIDRVHVMIATLNAVENGRETLASAFSDDTSLFVKSLQSTLTTEQLVNYEPLRSVYRLGGEVRTRQGALGEALEVRFVGGALTDDDLRILSKLPGLATLCLWNTQATDSATAELRSAIPGLMIQKQEDFAKPLIVTIYPAPNGADHSILVGLMRLFEGPLDAPRLRQLDRRLSDALAIDGAFERLMLRVGAEVGFVEVTRIVAVCIRQSLADGTPVGEIDFVELGDQSPATDSLNVRVFDLPPDGVKAGKDVLVLNISANGDLVAEGQRYDLNRYIAREGGIRRRSWESKGAMVAPRQELPTMVVLRADHKMPFRLLYKVLTLCQKYGFRKFTLCAMAHGSVLAPR
jgi:biopolymer transport protein ExbD